MPIRVCEQACANLQAVIEELKAENARLKAEVEKLTFDPSLYLDDAGEWMPRHIHLTAVERLKAENERLTKAGDAMASIIKYHPDANAFDAVPDVVKRWNAAKEGRDL